MAKFNSDKFFNLLQVATMFSRAASFRNNKDSTKNPRAGKDFRRHFKFYIFVDRADFEHNTNIIFAFVVFD